MNLMRAIGAMVIGSVVIIGFVFVGIYWTGYQAKRLTSKDGRKEIRAEVKEFSSFVATDKDFHKAINKEFKGTYIIFGLVVVALIATALGLG
jgi:hypothetical protein